MLSVGNLLTSNSLKTTLRFKRFDRSAAAYGLWQAEKLKNTKSNDEGSFEMNTTQHLGREICALSFLSTRKIINTDGRPSG